MSYKTNSNLDFFIKQFQKEESIKQERDLSIQEVMEMVANYSDVSWTTVKQMKNRNLAPSLPVAIRIADFFETTVEEIWTVEYIDSIIDDEKKKSIKKEKKEVKCKEADCTNIAISRGFCNKHYQQYRYKNKELFKKENPNTCTIENCNEPYHAKGMCAFHYNRQYREAREKTE